MSTPHTAPRTAQSGGAEESRIHGGEGVNYSRPGLVGYLTFPQGAVDLRDATVAAAAARQAHTATQQHNAAVTARDLSILTFFLVASHVFSNTAND